MSVDSSYQSDAINKRRQLRELMSARRATELRPIGASSSTLIPDLQNRHEPFPLTDIQEAYWLGRDTAFPLGGVGIHGYFELLCPDLDVERLQEAWNAVVRRHDMMRAIVLCDGSARIIEHVPCYIIPVEDLRDRTTQEQQRHRHELRARMSHQVFDVEKWPLFELRIVRLDQHRFRLHYSEDAIHSDLRSTALVMSDWLQLYRDPAVQLRPIPLSYRDYALAMHRRPQSADYARAKRYWDARLDTLPESPQLPLKGNLTGLRMAFARRKFTLTASRWQRFREQASKHGLTPSDALLATYVDVLGLWSTRRRFALNVTLQNRLPLHSQVNEISGDFTSFVLLDVDAGSSGGFVERASRYRDQLWSDLEHNEMSGVSVLRELARRRRSGDVVAPYVFTSALGTSGYRAIEELGEVEFEITQTPQVLLDQQAVEWRGQLVLTWDCVDAAFADGVIDEMFSWMSQRINQLCDEASEWSAQSRVSIPVAQQRRRDAFNATSAEFPRERLERMFARRAQEDRGRVAIVDHRGSMSYGELDDASSGLALALRAVPDLDAAVPVAIGMRKSRDEIVAVLGILKAGLSYLPLEISQPASRIERILSTAGCRAVIVDDDAPEWISRLEGRRRVLSLKDGQSAGNFAELPEIRDSDVAAYVLFTSGSTGDPKGVVVTHDSVVNRMLDVVERFAIGRHDRAMGLTGLHHDLAVFDIFGMLSVAGGTLIVPSPDVIEAPAKWPDFIDAHGVSIWNSVPAYLDLLLAHCEARPAQAARICGLRLALIAGDFIPPSLPLRFRGNTHGRFIALGGPTETTVWDICYPVEALPHGWSAIPYGKPMRNAKYFVLREDLSECPDWVEGELCIAGAGLAIGYLRDTVLSGARFVTHPESGERIYRSGDRGRVRPDGLVEILGRLDRQVKLSGHRIELGEVEAALRRHPLVSNAAVRVAGGAAPRLIAFVTPRVQVDMFPHASPETQPRYSLREWNPPSELARKRGSARAFSDGVVPFELFARLIACLCDAWEAEGARRRYPTAGGGYTVRVFVHVVAGRIVDVAPGLYILDATGGLLTRCSESFSPALDVHAPWNMALAAQAAFTLFFVGDIAALEGKYGPWARELCLVESGYMGQLVACAAAELGLGVCPIGGLDFPVCPSQFPIAAGADLMHSMLGGMPLSRSSRLTESVAPAAERISPEAVRRFLRDEIPQHMVPAEIIFLRSLPLTANGKIDAAALDRIIAARQVDEAWHIPRPPEHKGGVPRRDIATILKDLIGTEVREDQPFMEAGASSVHLVQLHARLCALGYSLDKTAVFLHPTVYALAAFLDGHSPGENELDQLTQRQAMRRRALALARERRSE